MKICHLNVLWVLNHGLLKKFADQSRVFKELSNTSIEVECVVIIRQRIIEETIHKLPFRIITVPKREPRWLEEILLPFDTWKIIDEQICPNYQLTVMRWLNPTWKAIQIASRYPLFTEHHTKELEEIHLQFFNFQSWGKYFLERLFAPRLLKKVAGVIGVTDEIRRYQLARGDKYSPSIVMPNGIDIQSIPVNTSVTSSRGKLEVAFLSNRFAKWHGLDRILNGLMCQPDHSDRIHLHLIGKLTTTQKQHIHTNNLQDRVTIHSTLQGQNLDYVLQKCHIALGPLAIHRNGLTEACPLKCREYTARGLPFVTSFIDPDFPIDCPWILRVAPDDSPIDITEIISFTEKTIRNPTLKKKMRQWAQDRLCWQYKLKQLIMFMHKNH